jgi:hypothetical protein
MRAAAFLLLLCASASAQPAGVCAGRPFDRAKFARFTSQILPHSIGFTAGELFGMGWSPCNVYELEDLLYAGVAATAIHLKRHPKLSDVAGGYCHVAGVATNINGTATADLSRGCIGFQGAVFGALMGNRPDRTPWLPRESSLEAHMIAYQHVFQHHAVVLIPKQNGVAADGKKEFANGIVLDGWPCQSSAFGDMIYLYRDWVPPHFSVWLED